MDPQPPVIPRDQVAEHLAVPAWRLVRYEARGLIHAVRAGEIEGYPPPEIRRISTILSLQRDLGVNLAGVEVILRLREHLDEVQRQLARLTHELQETFGDETEPSSDPDA